ncbi:MAG: hypothetical protein JW797_19460 [Bradymonadales bacterium]|nr:hypothetical protein [Bradymonadales bacterium]
MPLAAESSIPPFNRQFFDPSQVLSRIGSGALGGKASGLVLIQQKILSALSPDTHPDFQVRVPIAAVLATDTFHTFLRHNDLYPIALSDQPDDRIAHAFQKADLSPLILGDLRALITQVHSPLAVRSSSLLEDQLDHPFAGVYATKMIPNNQPDIDTRFRKLVEAIKFVYASTFFRAAKSYLRSIGQPPDIEGMAVIIQEIVGQRRHNRFYPTLSGVARSFNYYPTSGTNPEDGVVNLALGLGKTIVDGGICWTYAPTRPKAPPPYKSLSDMLKNTQTEYWAVHMGPPPMPDPIRETEYLVRAPLEQAEREGSLDLIASTYDPRSDRLFPGIGRPGPRILTFAPLLVSQRLPLNPLIRRLLDLARHTLQSDVEIEFAVNLDPRGKPPAQLGFLQVRPMMLYDQAISLEPHEMQGPDVLLASQSVLGHGICRSIQDVVFVKPEAFDTSYTHQIAAEIEQRNRVLLAESRPYLLIGFGRWGSTDPWMGIPVEWGQICGAQVIVEATLPEVNPDLSQGSHFFHNLIAFRVLYLSLPHAGRYGIDYDWLSRQETIAEGRFVKHVRTSVPLFVQADGRRARAVVKHHE